MASLFLLGLVLRLGDLLLLLGDLGLRRRLHLGLAGHLCCWTCVEERVERGGKTFKRFQLEITVRLSLTQTARGGGGW